MLCKLLELSDHAGAATIDWQAAATDVERFLGPTERESLKTLEREILQQHATGFCMTWLFKAAAPCARKLSANTLNASALRVGGSGGI